MRSRKFTIAAFTGGLALFGFGWAQVAHTAADGNSPSDGLARIRFTFDHPQLVPSHYVIVINEKGQGHYQSATSPEAAKPSMTNQSTQPLDRDITITPATLNLLFSTARERKLFAITCDNSSGKVAFRGNKVLAYEGQDGKGSCQFSWSKDQKIDKVSDVFESLAFTLEEGERLAVEQRHDRLALDTELQTLVNAAKEDRAVELQNIAPQLEAIAQDESVLSRARQRARLLLQSADTH